MYVVPLSHLGFAFGHVCVGLDHAFYDLCCDVIPPLDTIVSSPIAFRVPVARDAVAAAGWTIVGNVPPSGELAKPGVYRHQPVGSPTAYRYSAGATSLADESKLDHLEPLATWFSHHIEQRLRDHFNGVPNETARLLKRPR